MGNTSLFLSLILTAFNSFASDTIILDLSDSQIVKAAYLDEQGAYLVRLAPLPGETHDRFAIGNFNDLYAFDAWGNNTEVNFFDPLSQNYRGSILFSDSNAIFLMDQNQYYKFQRVNEQTRSLLETRILTASQDDESSGNMSLHMKANALLFERFFKNESLGHLLFIRIEKIGSRYVMSQYMGQESMTDVEWSSPTEHKVNSDAIFNFLDKGDFSAKAIMSLVNSETLSFGAFGSFNDLGIREAANSTTEGKHESLLVIDSNNAIGMSAVGKNTEEEKKLLRVRPMFGMRTIYTQVITPATILAGFDCNKLITQNE